MHWPARALLILGIVGLAAVALLHAGLIPRGAWGADEFQTFGMFRAHGWQYLWFRFISWSPRPFSEALIALYAALERMQPSPVVTLNRAVVIARLKGADVALEMIAPLEERLAGYFPYFATRGAFLLQLLAHLVETALLHC
ncbi:MAG: hypothetical protein J0H57_12400, partial [Rhodospirillales bacterium]|nr:hypothetical protein [Rhodospirillales bacterium]